MTVRNFTIIAYALLTSMVGTSCALEANTGDSAEDGLQAALSEGDVYDSLGRPLDPLTAEIVRINGTADADFNLVARVLTQPRELVEFYEPRPGLIMVSGAGAPDPLPWSAENALAEDSTILEYWSFISDDAPIPDALEAAIARSGQPEATMHRAYDPPKGFEEPTEDPSASASAQALIPTDSNYAHLYSDWCDSTYYSYTPAGYDIVLGSCPNYDFTVCWDHVTGTGSAWHDDALITRSNVCPYDGNVTFNVDADEGWITQGSWTVLENTYRWKYVYDSGCAGDPFNDCPYIKTWITNASGDGYHYRFHVYEEP